MADRTTEIETLRARLRQSRQRVSDSVETVSDRLDLPARIRQEVTAHPWRWAAIALIGGAVASRLLPVVFGVSRKVIGSRALKSLVATAAPLAARAALSAWNARFPEPTPHPYDPEDERSGDI
jgi:hypothetical protein